MMPKIIIDDCIPYAKGLLEAHASVSYLPCEQFSPATIADADALLVRTRLRCDSALLADSHVRFIGTASIGFDHIDLDYCRAAGITVANAPGCNAPAVAQYVFAAIARFHAQVEGLTLGVVGVGNVGSIVARWAQGMGMRVLRCDPPRAEREGSDGFASLEQVAREADIVTFHTPLTRTGAHPSLHLADEQFFAALQRRPLIINAARGGVVDEAAALRALERGAISHLVVDCWEGEPRLNPAVLAAAAIATPHIAGYSLDGKIRATQMSVDALCRSLGLPAVTVDAPTPAVTPEAIPLADVAASYDIMADDAALRRDPASFEPLRNYYHLRPEAQPRV